MKKILATAAVAALLMGAQPAPAHAGWFSNAWSQLSSWAGNTFGLSQSSSQSSFNRALDKVADAKADIDNRYRNRLISEAEYNRLTRANANLLRKVLATQQGLDSNGVATGPGTSNNPTYGCGCR